MQGPDLSWKQIMAGLMDQDMDIFPDSLRHLVAERLDAKNRLVQIEALERMGLFAETVATERLYTPLDTLVPHLAKALAYAPGERDLVILNHDIDTQLPSGSMVDDEGLLLMTNFFVFRNDIVSVSSLTAKKPKAAIRQWLERLVTPLQSYRI